MPNTEAKEAGHVTCLSGPSDRARGRIRLGKHRSFLQKKKTLNFIKINLQYEKKISGARVAAGLRAP
jgi:hypothetical protein